MGALPKKKRTRARIGNRQISYRVSIPQFSPCPQCHGTRRPHRVCDTCGYYNGRQAITKTLPTEQQSV